MQVNLFELAAKQSQWLSVRQSAIAGMEMLRMMFWD